MSATAVRPELALSRLEFDVVWEHLRLGPFPTVYRMFGHGQTHDERARLVAGAWEALEARGIGGPSTLDPLLVELLGVLAGPEREVDARFGHHGRETRALAGATGGRTALGVLAGGTFRFSRLTPGGLSRAIVRLLPEHAAGTGHSVTLSSRSFQEACGASGNTPKGLRAALIQRGLRADDAERLAHALDAPVGSGQFGVALRDRWGRRHRAPYVVAFADTASGRYLLESKPSAGGGAELWTTVAPTDRPRLTARVDQLLTGLQRDA